jgi:Tol biopolymer transport system component
MDEARQHLELLQNIVSGTGQFKKACAGNNLIKLPTGDGMALVFFGDPESAPRCALEVSKELRNHPELRLRMGLNNGPVYRVADINANLNVAGGGINTAQRVMDCGDAGHILVSRSFAEVLKHLRPWENSLHDLGEAEVKHGVILQIFNLYNDEAGRQATPQKFAAAQAARARVKKARIWMGAAACILLLAIGGFLYFHRPVSQPPMTIAPLTGSSGFEQEPAFSQDGSQVAYTWDGGKEGVRSIYIKRVASGRPFRLSDEGEGNVQSPAWSADGEMIAFVRPAGDKAEIWESPSLPGPKRKLGETSLYPANLNRHPGLTASPDGLYLATPSNGTTQEPPGIFLFSIKTGEWRRLTTAKYGDCQPSFSPDGKQIAFVGATTLGVEDLYVVPVAGGQVNRLTTDQARINGAAWTPDGREIVFASKRGGSYGLWKINVSGGEPEKLGITGDFLASPAISRRGNHLAYVQESSNTNIWSLEISAPGRAAGVPVKFIFSSKEESSPQYSPDGKRIVFVSDRTGNPQIWVCEKDGSNPIALTKFEGTIAGTPRWSPNGEQIVFDSRDTGESRIDVMRADGMGTPRPVTSGPGDDLVPSWSKDGKWIFFSSTRTGKAEVWKAPIAAGEPVQLTRDGGFAPLPSADGRFVYYAKGPTTAGLWRVPVDGGAETKVMDDLQVSFWGQWAATDAGIYFMSSRSKDQGGIQFFSFVTGKVKHIFTPEKPPDPWTDGLAVSPDGRTILYTQVDQRTTNIMLAEHFH